MDHVHNIPVGHNHKEMKTGNQIYTILYSSYTISLILHLLLETFRSLCAAQLFSNHVMLWCILLPANLQKPLILKGPLCRIQPTEYPFLTPLLLSMCLNIWWLSVACSVFPCTYIHTPLLFRSEIISKTLDFSANTDSSCSSFIIIHLVLPSKLLLVKTHIMEDSL